MSCSFSPEQLWNLADEFGTPLWVYDAQVIRARIAQLKAFDTIRFAQKACSNIHILKLMREQGVKVDAVSRGEILRAVAAGYVAGGEPSDIVFTADVMDAATLATVVEHQVPVNAGSIDMLHQLGAASPGHHVWLRINPGFGHGHSNKTNTGGEHSKHGIWHTDLNAALDAIAQHGLHLAGLHMHIGSGVDYSHLQEVCGAMVALVKRAKEHGHDLQAISAGGGLSIPYREGDATIDTAHYFGLWNEARKQAEAIIGHPLGLEIEPGRFLVAESGVLLGTVRATKGAGSNHFVLVDTGFNELMRPSMYGSYHGMHIQRRGVGVLPATVRATKAAGNNHFILVDTGFNELMRPSMYGSYHGMHIQRRGQGVLPATRDSVVAGPLCESGDVFTQGDGGVVLPRSLGDAQVGDLLVIHNTGAYGSSMSSNYNTRPLAAEVLVDGAQVQLIRRRQTVEELLALELGL